MKYTIFIILGIILFLLWNTINGFIVGLPFCIRDPSDPTTPLDGDLNLINDNPDTLRRRIQALRRIQKKEALEQSLVTETDPAKIANIRAQLAKIERQRAKDDNLGVANGNSNVDIVVPPLMPANLTIVECDDEDGDGIGDVHCDDLPNMNYPTGGATGNQEVDDQLITNFRMGYGAQDLTAATRTYRYICEIDPRCNVPTTDFTEPEPEPEPEPSHGCVTFNSNLVNAMEIPSVLTRKELLNKYINHFNSLDLFDIDRLKEINDNPRIDSRINSEGIRLLNSRYRRIWLQNRSFFKFKDGEYLTTNEIEWILDTINNPNPHLIGRISDEEYEFLRSLLRSRTQSCATTHVEEGVPPEGA
jgi:hypothetical protein